MVTEMMQLMDEMGSRRDFLKMSAMLPLAMSLGSLGSAMAEAQTAQATGEPWFRRVHRWGQINLNEQDPIHFDIPWWRSYWKRTETQGVVINAGGIVAYYPSKEPLHHQASYLNGRDLYGELVRAAHADGLAVFARMDSSSAFEPSYKAHPDWFAVNAAGEPYRTGSVASGAGTSGVPIDDIVLYAACIHGPYFEEYIPRILREVISHEKPEGFTDNHWFALSRESICYCNNCKAKFHEYCGRDLPARKNWDDQSYRRWIEWNYKRRMEIWDLYNHTTKSAGGADCVWSGMLSGNLLVSAHSFRDLKEICERADVIMLDHQSRTNDYGFQENGDSGKMIHGLGGWDKPANEAMALWGPSRKSSRPAAEVHIWMVEGFAGTVRPWWHHIGGYQEDRRQFQSVEATYRWHAANQEYLFNRRPIATVGVVYSQRNLEFYGRDDDYELAMAPYIGMIQALIRGRIPYLPVHADHIGRDADQFSVLILPNLAAMSAAQVAAVRRFVRKGGSLIATGETSLYDEYGDPRPDFALADVLGANYTGKKYGPRIPTALQHTYLRLTPDVGQDIDGPRHGDEPVHSVERHAVLRGFEATNLIAFGGELPDVRPAPGTTVLLTLVPESPTAPPENAWLRIPRSQIPGLVIRERNGARVAFLPADIDRRYASGNLPDHGNLLANLVRWAASDSIPLVVQGPGLIDCHLFRQPADRQHDRLILHLVNLTSAGTWRAPVEELIPVGPLTVRVKLPEGVPTKLRLLLTVSGATDTKVIRQGNWAQFEVRSVLDHEVAVLE
jgi:hypothetical protein